MACWSARRSSASKDCSARSPAKAPRRAPTDRDRPPPTARRRPGAVGRSLNPPLCKLRKSLPSNAPSGAFFLLLTTIFHVERCRDLNLIPQRNQRNIRDGVQIIAALPRSASHSAAQFVRLAAVNLHRERAQWHASTNRWRQTAGSCNRPTVLLSRKCSCAAAGPNQVSVRRTRTMEAVPTNRRRESC